MKTPAQWALLTVLLLCAHVSARPFGGVPITVGNQALGMNLAALAYYSPEQPFINIMKSGGGSPQNGYGVGWLTNSTSGASVCGHAYFDTCEEAYLQLDTDGYPLSMTASPTPPGGQVFNEIQTYMNFNMPPLAPGASYIYPPGQYRLKFKGQGTISMGDDASVQSGDTCGGGVTLTNSTAGAYASCTFHVVTPSTTGLVLTISAIGPTDHPTDISVVLQSNAAAYDAGAIFNPSFLAMLAPFSSLRFMEWKNTNSEFSGQQITGSSITASSQTSVTLTSNWAGPTQTLPIIFIDGEQRSATFTINSPAVTWSGGLTNTLSSASNWTWGSQAYYSPFFIITKTWANRSKPSNAFWDNADGVPLEVAVSLCNQIRTNCYLNLPMMYSDSDIEAEGQLVMSGTGMQSGFLGLTSTLTSTFELSNEIWNTFNFNQGDIAGSLGYQQWPGQPSGGGNTAWQQNWEGMRTAQIASDLQTAVGSTVFARVYPTLGAWGACTSCASTSLNSSYWSGGAAYSYPIKDVNINSYWGTTISSGDCTHMVGVTTPLDDFFATLTGNVGTSGNGSFTYSSMPSSGGQVGVAETQTTNFLSLLGSYPQKLIVYEGGPGYLANSVCTGWNALLTSAYRDPRMSTQIVNFLDNWRSQTGSVTNVNQFNWFNDVTTISNTATFGVLESIMEPISPLSGAPSRYNGVVTYVLQ
jgi:hypothetical protein